MFTLNCHQRQKQQQRHELQQKEQEERLFNINYEKVKVETFPHLSAIAESATAPRPKASAAAPAGSIAILRECPEIMLRVYSFLPVTDRVYQLALVDRAFQRDNARSGFLRASLGPLRTLSDATHYLASWEDRLMTESGQVELRIHADDVRGLVVRIRRVIRRTVQSTEERDVRDDVPSFAGADQHWLSEAVFMEASRHAGSGESHFDTIGDLLRSEGLLGHFETYIKQYHSRGLDPTCKLFLPNVQGNWNAYCFQSCSMCSHMTQDHVAVSCSHWTVDRFICRTCDDGVTLYSSNNSRPKNGRAVRRALTCEECYSDDLQIILGSIDSVYARLRTLNDAQCTLISQLSALTNQRGGAARPSSKSCLASIVGVMVNHGTLSDEVTDLALRLNDTASAEFDANFSRYLKQRSSARMKQLLERKRSADAKMAAILQRKAEVEIQDTKDVAAE